MDMEAGHRYGSVRLGALVLAVSFAVLVCLGASSPALASGSNGATSSPTTLALVRQARAAMARAGSVSAIGHGAATVPGLGKVTITETDYSGANSGSQVVTAASSTEGEASLPAATTLDVDGTVYVNANASFWSRSFGLGSASTAPIAGRWVGVPKSSPVYGPAVADLTMPSLIGDLFHADSYRTGKTRTIDGVRAVALSYHNTGGDAGPVTCWVATGGNHLPILVIIGGLTLRLGSWGVTKAVSVPAGAIPLPETPSSTPSGLPVVA
jgi:hypothetical protein